MERQQLITVAAIVCIVVLAAAIYWFYSGPVAVSPAGAAADAADTAAAAADAANTAADAATVNAVAATRAADAANSAASQAATVASAVATSELSRTSAGTQYRKSFKPSCRTTTGSSSFPPGTTLEQAIDMCAQNKNLGGNGPCVGIEPYDMVLGDGKKYPWSGCLSTWDQTGTNPSYLLA